MPLTPDQQAKQRAGVAAYQARMRALKDAPQKDAMDSPAPPAMLDRPVLLHLGEDAPPDVSPAALPPPALAPLPPAPTAAELLALGPLPADHQPFSFADPDVLTPTELQAITEFNALYMQPPGLRAHLMALPAHERLPTLARIQASARGTDGTNGILAYLRKQYRLACRGVGGAQSQEAQQVQRNLQWVEQELLQGEDV
jgi:hypothetical protein